MPLTGKQWRIIAAVTAVLAVVVTASVVVGVVVGRRRATPDTVHQRVYRLLDEHPLIDG